MVLQELLLSGIRNFTKLKKIDFAKGLNMIIGENGSGKTTIYDTILSILFGDSYTPSKTLVCEAEQECKAALTFKDKKSETHRIIRDFTKDKANLFKLDSSNNFILINKNKEMIDQLLDTEIIGLKEEEYTYLFSLKYPLYISNGLYQKVEEAVSADAPSFNEMSAFASLSLPVDRHGADREPAQGFDGNSLESESMIEDKIKSDEELLLKENRLNTLKEALTKADQLSKIEYQIDEIQSRISDNRKRLENISQTTKELEKAANIIESLKIFAELPSDLNIEYLIENYEKKEIEKKEALESVNEELTLLNEERGQIAAKPVFQNPFFIAGAALIIISLFSVVSFDLIGVFQILFLLGFFGGGGLITFAIFNDSHNNNKRKALDVKINNLNKQLNAATTKYGKEDALFQDILKKTSSGNAHELGLKYNKYRELLEEKKFLEEKLERSFDGKKREEIEGELTKLQKEKAGLEGKVQGYIGLSTDIYDLQAEIKKIEKEIKEYRGSGKPVSPMSADRQGTGRKEIQKGAPAKTVSKAAGSHSGQGDIINWLILERILGKDPRDLLPIIENKAKAYLQRLTLGKYSGLSINGGIYLSTKNSEKKAELNKLSRGLTDQTYLALHLALISILSSKFPFPLLIDDPFLSFDPQREDIAVEILREIGKSNQIIFLSSHKVQKSGDNVIQL